MIKYFFSLFIVILTGLSAENTDSFEGQNPNPLSNYEGLPSGIVAGCVNVITGDYFEMSRDLTLPLPEPLAIERFYTSSDTYGPSFEKGTLTYGWNLNHTGLLTVCTQSKNNKKFQHCHLCLDGGMNLYFDKKSKTKLPSHHYLLSHDMIRWGLTNTSRGEISGRTNLKNMHVDKSEGTVARVTDGSGTVKTFERDKLHFYRLTSEKRPNGNSIHYAYDEDKRLRKVGVKNAELEEIGFVLFDYPSKEDYKNNPRMIAYSCDNRQIFYNFGEANKRLVLKECHRTEGPADLYEYEKIHKRADRFSRVVQKRRPDGSFLNITYIEDHNKLTSDTASSYVDCKVSALYAPVGKDSKPVRTHKFGYMQSDPVTGHGKTKVITADDRETIYDYDLSRRLCSISRDRKKELFVWGQKGSENEGNLLSKLLDEPGHKIHFCKRFFYDDRGNVIKERLYGQLTGNSTGIGLDAAGLPTESGDYDDINREFSNDGFNLIVRENFGIYQKTYRYKSGTDLLIQELTWADGQVKKRVFYDYDKNAAKSLEIIDNGCSENIHDLSGVTERRISRIENTKSIPVGLPREISELYLDLKTGQEVLLHRTVNNYQSDGLIREQLHFDVNNQHVYTLFWEYDQYGNPIKEVNAMGQTIFRRYDELSRLVYEEGPLQGYSKKYAYDYAGRLIEKVECSQDGKIDKTVHEYNILNQRVKTIDSNNHTVEFKYDEEGFVKEKTIIASNDNGNKVLFCELYKNDILGNVLSKTDSLGNTIISTYTVSGKPVTITYPDKSIEKYQYTLKGLLKEVINRNGLKTQYTHDYQGRVVSEEYFDLQNRSLGKKSRVFNTFHLIEEKDPMNYSIFYEYDGAGRLIREHSEISEINYSYDFLGNIAEKSIATTVEKAVVTRWSYNFLNQIVSESVHNEKSDLLRSVNYKYDCMGNKTDEISETADGIAITHTDYDCWGRITKIIDPLGYQTTTYYDDHFSDKYNQLVEKVELIDSKGGKFITVHDPLGRVAYTIRKNTQNKILAEEEYSYDANGNRVSSMQTVYSAGELSRIVCARFQYNWEGKLTQCIEADGTSEQKVTTYVYNNAGEKVQTQKPDGTTIRYIYDEKGRLKEFNSSDRTVDYIYTYDFNDLPFVIENRVNHKATIRAYNAEGMIVSEILENGLETKYQYDLSGQLVRLTYPGIGFIEYVYDGDQMKAVSRYDIQGTLQYTHTYDKYDPSGLLLNSTMIGNAGGLKCRYDVNDQVRAIESSTWKCTIPEEGYDSLGNLLSCQIDDALGNVMQYFAYDDLDQISEENGMVSHTYVNDSIHNIVSRDSFKRQTNSLNQLLKEDEAIYRYDANGNLISLDVDGKFLNFTYDALDRLQKVESEYGTTLYFYDAFNRRMEKIVNGVNELYLYTDQCEVGSFVSDVCREFRVLGIGQGAEIGASIAVELEGKTFAPMHNISGHIVTLIDAVSGEVSDTYRYSAYGQEISISSLKNPWRFAGKRYDPETGFVNFGIRYYSTNMAKWITPDPIGFNDGPNLYAYVHNNPINNFDEYGLFMMSRPNFSEGRTLPTLSRIDNFAPEISDRKNSWESVKREWDNFNSACYTSPLKFDPNESLLDFTWRSYYHMEDSYRKHDEYLRFSVCGSEVGILDIVTGGPVKGWITSSFKYISRSFVRSSVLEMTRKAVNINHVCIRVRGTAQIIENSIVPAARQCGKEYFKSRTPSNGLSDFLPKKYFKRKTFQDMEKLLESKFGPSRGGATGGASFFNRATKRTFHIHREKGHLEGKPHVDVRKRGVKTKGKDKKQFILQE